jgi:PH/SEC7 domain-containing protein
MSRTQFVRNTLTAIQMQLHPDSPALSASDLTYDDCSSSVRGSDDTEIATRTKRSNSITSWNSLSKELSTPATASGHSPVPTGSLVSMITDQASLAASRQAYDRQWEVDMEGLLKVRYDGHEIPFIAHSKF